MKAELKITILALLIGILVAQPSGNCQNKPYFLDGKCVDSCGSKVDIGNFICDCPQKKLFDNCLDACPAGTNPKPFDNSCGCPGVQFLSDDLKCYDVCPSNRLPNLDTQQCEVCPNGQGLSNGVCSPCAITETLFDNICNACPVLQQKSADKCVACAAKQTVVAGVCTACTGVIDGGKCVPSCPSYKILSKDGVCVCPDATKFFTGNSCVSSCPSDKAAVDAANNCIACPQGQFLDKSAAPFKCIATCTKGINNGECVACPVSAVNLDNGKCVASCSGGRTADATTKVCKCATTKVWNPSSSTCDSACPSNMVLDAAKINCNACSAGQVVSGTACVAASTCIPPKYVSNGECKACPTVIENGACVSACTVTSRIANATTKNCECPKNTPLEDNGACVAACSAGKSSNGIKCDFCPIGTAPDANGKCNPCPTGKGIMNGVCTDVGVNCPAILGNMCVSSCPAITTLNATSKVCQCPLGQLFDGPTQVCVTKCPANRVPNKVTMFCDCGQGKKYGNAGTCVNICPPSTKPDDVAGTCVIISNLSESCNSFVKIRDLSGNCVCNGVTINESTCSSCTGTDLFNLNTKLCTACASGYKMDNFCFDSCPQYLFADPVAKKCVTACADGQYIDMNLRQCLAACPDGKTANALKICECDASKGLNLVSNACVDCQSKIRDNLGVCLDSCDRLLDGDRCVDKCPNDKVKIGRFCIKACTPAFTEGSYLYDVGSSFNCIARESCTKKIDLNFCVDNCLGDKTPDALGVCQCPAGYVQDPNANRCIPQVCGLGKEQNDNGGCKYCDDGYYNDGSLAICKKCPYGSISSDSKAFCTTCPKDKVCLSNGLVVNATDCNKFGKVPNKSGNSCVNCEAGKIMKSDGSCIDCPNGTYSNDQTDGYCLSCPAGTEPNAEKSRCKQCANGKYKDENSTACMDCNSVKSLDRKSCISCPSGLKYDSASNSCKRCDLHFIINGTLDICTECKLTENTNPIGDTCLPCPSGTKFDPINKDCSAKCAARKIINSELDDCTACTEGQYVNSLGDTCLHCPSGYIFDLVKNDCSARCGAHKIINLDLDVCTDCQAAEKVNSTFDACVPCPEGQTYDVGLDSCKASA